MVSRSLTSPSPSSPSALAWSLIVALGIIWGGAFFLARIAVMEVPPLTLVLLRVALAALTLHVVLAVTGRSVLAHRGAWRLFLGMGLLNNAVPFSLLFVGQTALSAGLASILNATTPIWTVLIAHWATSDERMSAGRLAGIALGFAGVATLFAPALVDAVGSPVWAMACVVGAAISYGFAGVVGRRLAGIPPIVSSAGQLTASTLVMAPVAVLVHRGLPLDYASGTWAAVVALAVVSTALAYVLFFRILALSGAVNVSLVTLIVPASAIVLGAVFLGERLAPSAWAGLALIAAGLLVLDRRLVALVRGRAAA